MERVAGIEPARSAWEADRLPLHHTRPNDRLRRVSPTALLLTGVVFNAFASAAIVFLASLAGLMDGSRLTCSKHLWQWDLESGEVLGAAERPLLFYKVKQEGGDILAFLDSELVYDYDEEDDFDDDDFFDS